MPPGQYGRVLLKLSGEALMGDKEFGLSPDFLAFVAGEVRAACDLGAQIAIVVGGGNIFRGMKAGVYGMDRTAADHMGMLATVMNSIALQNVLEKTGIATRVLSAISMESVAEPYVQRHAVAHLEKGRVVICAAGTGNPFFTTDTAAVLRAQEIHADVLLKATNVDYLYDAHPGESKDAKPIFRATYMHVLEKQLRVMDLTAISLAMETRLPLIIFNLRGPGNIQRAIRGETIGTFIGDEDHA